MKEKKIYVRKAELAQLLSVSPRSIDNWIAKRMIPVVATSQRLHLFDVEAVKGALEEGFEVPVSGRMTRAS
jgi:phage terminase Nu1 subunit (DNA packaging protein)